MCGLVALGCLWGIPATVNSATIDWFGLSPVAQGRVGLFMQFGVYLLEAAVFSSNVENCAKHRNHHCNCSNQIMVYVSSYTHSVNAFIQSDIQHSE